MKLGLCEDFFFYLTYPPFKINAKELSPTLLIDKIKKTNHWRCFVTNHSHFDNLFTDNVI